MDSDTAEQLIEEQKTRIGQFADFRKNYAKIGKSNGNCEDYFEKKLEKVVAYHSRLIRAV